MEDDPQVDPGLPDTKTSVAAAQFPVVGVGASAGGLTATSELLQHLGSDPGMAVVIIHHLDPNRVSDLPEILSRVTTLPVITPKEPTPIAVNHVYVVPHDADLLLVGDTLQLAPRREVRVLHLPVDAFFQSLAVARETFAIGVILSGTGLDGSEGVRAIKSNGGVTFAQDASAQHTAMPESAVATGCIDFVMPAAAIANELRALGSRLASLAATNEEARELRRILGMLVRATGVNYEHYKQTTVRRRVQRRVVVHGLSSLREYAALLARDPEEVKILAEEILVHVTSFFRDPEMFDALKAAALPKLMEKRPHDSGFRIWVPGCSTGEEVYSLAITFLEFLEDVGAKDTPIKLFGTDVSETAIDKARAGRYPVSIERDVSSQRLQRFFIATDAGYQIRPEVRQLCVFAKQDATNDPPFSGLDLVSCRNLMIYLDAPLQERLLPLLHYALKEPGMLVLGSSETTRSFPGFVVFDAKHKIYTRTSAAPRALLDFGGMRSLGAAPSVVPPPLEKSSSAADVHREADRLVLAEFGPPGLVITDDLAIVQFRGQIGPFLEPSPGVASFDLRRMVRADLRLALRQLIDEARAEGRVTRRAESYGFPPRGVELEVIPFAVGAIPQRYLVVLFKDQAAAEPASTNAVAPAPTPSPSTDTQLSQELAATRAYLQSVIEQLEASNEELRAANEEVVSSNEELRSTNEELQLAKEELQSTNEELRTVNEEMAIRNRDVIRANDDLVNILGSVDIPILILDKDLRVRRITPAATRVFRLGPADLGRPISEATQIGCLTDMQDVVKNVLENLSPAVQEIHHDNGRWYQLKARPYLTLDKRVDGVVVSIYDIDALTLAKEMFHRAQRYAESVVDTIREGLVVLDHDLIVQSANHAFGGLFSVVPRQILGRPLRDVGAGELNIPLLHTRLQGLAEGETIEGFRVDLTDENGDQRTLMLNARRIENTSSVLLAIENITERQRAFDRVHRYQRRLQSMAFDAAVAEERERRRLAIVLHDSVGQTLGLARMKLVGARGTIGDGAASVVEESIELISRALSEARTLTFDLSPPVLYDLGLTDALEWLADDLERRHDLSVKLQEIGEPVALEEETAGLVFRAIRELLTNVVKHAETASASVSLRNTATAVEIEVADGGRGFHPDGDDKTTGEQFGLFSVREQISRLGGRMEVYSAPGDGTRVRLWVPLKSLERPPSTPSPSDA